MCSELADVAQPQPGAVDDAGVVLLVQVDHVAPLDQAGDRAQIDLEAGGEGDGRRLAHEVGELFFQLFVDDQRAVEEPAPAATGAEASDGLDGGFLDLGVVGQAQVVVAAEHDQRLSADSDLRVLGRFEGAEVRDRRRRP